MRHTGLEEARRVFDNVHLKLPPVPERFVHRLHKQGEWCFASRRIDPMQLYFFDEYLQEVLMGKTSDYVAFSHAGQGVNSYAISYSLVDGPLALMVQAPFGGGYMDDAETRRGVEAQFDRCAALSAAVEEANAQGPRRRSGRLCVFESALRDLLAWGWLAQPLSDDEAVRSWLDEHRIPREAKDQDLTKTEFPTNIARDWIATL